VRRVSFVSTVLLAVACTVTAPRIACAQAQDDDPGALRLAEPDFALISLPTSLRLPTFGSSFRVTHRFLRPLGQGDFGDLAGDLFAIDSGAQIGLEYRFGVIKNGQVAFHRTSNKTIQLLGQYSVMRQSAGAPFDVSALFTIEGTNNFKDSYSPSIGAIISRDIGTFAALYLEPIWVNNTNPLPKQLADHNDTFIVGIGARIRVMSTVYITGEVAPQASGFKPGQTHGAFAIEKRVGGHLFQLNFSDNIGTTMAQIARGGPPQNDWFMGFNISRKFF
jgi:hypothetical protein